MLRRLTHGGHLSVPNTARLDETNSSVRGRVFMVLSICLGCVGTRVLRETQVCCFLPSAQADVG